MLDLVILSVPVLLIITGVALQRRYVRAWWRLRERLTAEQRKTPPRAMITPTRAAQRLSGHFLHVFRC